MTRLPFTLDATSPKTLARATTFKTLHGTIKTPVFMPVGTQATVKGMKVEDLKKVGSQMILGNTYHLLLRPGPQVFERFGGIHKFMNWDGPVLTDSGGFQIFSLPNDRKILEEGASFKSYIDGQTILLSPEVSIAMQRAMKSDVMMVLDECVPSTSPHQEAARAMEVTHRWALRSLKARGESPQALFAIVQGACFEDLRKESADFLTSLDFDGFAIGGLAVGETRDEREHFTQVATQYLPVDKPRYLMGVGMPIDLLEAVHRGVDMFDWIIPSALAKQGTAFTHEGLLRLRRGVYKFDSSPIDPNCSCYACSHYSRAYIHHLTKATEGLGWHLLTHHNLEFYHQLTAEMRAHIIQGTFHDYYLDKRQRINRKDSDGKERGLFFPGKIKTVNAADDHFLAPPANDSPYAPDPFQKGRYKIVSHTLATDDGGTPSWYLVDQPSGESMHPRNSPFTEALELYVLGSSLLRQLAPSDIPGTEKQAESKNTNLPVPPTAPVHEALPASSVPTLVVWDVGLGAGYNAMALLGFIARHRPQNMRVRLVSFENDLDSFKLALEHRDKFPHMRHQGPELLLRQGFWQHPHEYVRWELIQGDFASALDEAADPHVIFYDPFSTKTNPSLWSFEIFKKIFAKCHHQSSELLTYSTSTRVRSALLAAGFHVGKLPNKGPQQEATFAFTPPLARKLGNSHHRAGQLLSAGWLTRWEKSSAKLPWDVLESQEDQDAFFRRVTQHPQFVSLGD